MEFTVMHKDEPVAIVRLSEEDEKRWKFKN